MMQVSRGYYCHPKSIPRLPIQLTVHNREMELDHNSHRCTLRNSFGPNQLNMRAIRVCWSHPPLRLSDRRIRCSILQQSLLLKSSSPQATVDERAPTTQQYVLTTHQARSVSRGPGGHVLFNLRRVNKYLHLQLPNRAIATFQSLRPLHHSQTLTRTSQHKMIPAGGRLA